MIGQHCRADKEHSAVEERHKMKIKCERCGGSCIDLNIIEVQCLVCEHIFQPEY